MTEIEILREEIRLLREEISLLRAKIGVPVIVREPYFHPAVQPQFAPSYPIYPYIVTCDTNGHPATQTT